MTNACQRVIQIVNQPVKAYLRGPDMRGWIYKPGWFHPGAIKPDFNTVDIRQSQDLNYAQHKYVASDLNPGVVFLGQDLEFNSMTKYFYTNRVLPKHRLAEAEMLEINKLYRVIGRCEAEIRQLQSPAATETVQPTTARTGVGPTVPSQPFESLRRIPKRKRLLYGSIAIGILIVLMVSLRLFRKGARHS
jgi:hypothetical protein